MNCIQVIAEKDRLKLSLQCAERKAKRHKTEAATERMRKIALQKRIDEMKKKLDRCHLRALVAEQAADRVKRGLTDASDLDKGDPELMRELEKEGVSLRDIADKFDTDLITVACAIEGIV